MSQVNLQSLQFRRDRVVLIGQSNKSGVALKNAKLGNKNMRKRGGLTCLIHVCSTDITCM